MAHDKCICWKTTQDERLNRYVHVERDELSHVIRDNKWGGVRRTIRKKGREGGRWCSICLSSPRLCCLLMTPPNVHLRSSLFRWALCRLVTDRHTWQQTDKHGRHEERAQMLNKHTAHKWHGSNPVSPIISYMEDIKTRPQSKTWWTVRVDGWRLQRKC